MVATGFCGPRFVSPFLERAVEYVFKACDLDTLISHWQVNVKDLREDKAVYPRHEPALTCLQSVFPRLSQSFVVFPRELRGPAWINK